MSTKDERPLVDDEREAQIEGSASEEAETLEEQTGSQLQDENQIDAEVIDDILDTDETIAAEDAAVNTDNETARAINSAGADIDESEEDSKKAEAPEENSRGAEPKKVRSKKYLAVLDKVVKNKKYSLEEAVQLAKETSFTSFDGSIELHIRLKQGQKGATEAVRGLIQLPAGAVKTPNVAILDEDLIAKIAKDKTTEFDILIAPKNLMPKIAQIAKVLGPQGKMPSPKAGTVVDNPNEVVDAIKGGRVEYRADKQGIIHMAVGKVSWDSEKILENAKSVIGVLPKAKIVSISFAPTMGPGVGVDLTSF